MVDGDHDQSGPFRVDGSQQVRVADVAVQYLMTRSPPLRHSFWIGVEGHKRNSVHLQQYSHGVAYPAITTDQYLLLWHVQ